MGTLVFKQSLVVEMTGQIIKILFLKAVLFNLVLAQEETAQENVLVQEAKGKVLPVFQIVKFKNSLCSNGKSSDGTVRNGTCYTTQECDNRGGTKGSDCAEGFGVCCTFSISCGQTSSENATYLINTAATADCSYTICPASSGICRIRFDFDVLQLSGPVLGTAATNTNGVTTVGDALGDCVEDQFQISGLDGLGSPVICGNNDGHHMILDTDGESCVDVDININPSATATRKWTIQVAQYTCQNPYLGGPPGCLQYYTGTTGTIQNFNWKKSITAGTEILLTANAHLSSQEYDICFRREATTCSICFVTAIAGAADTSTNNGSFGLSIGDGTDDESQVGTNCANDYLQINGGETKANTETATLTLTIIAGSRFCGRYLGTDQTTTAFTTTVCTRQAPFTVTVKMDDNEVATGTAANTNEQTVAPSGLVGFQLNFAQQTASCV